MKDYIGIIIGLLLKIKYSMFFMLRIAPSRLPDDGPIVSLTSYGRRIKKTVPYTIFSIFEQKVKPSKIVLWIDKEEYNDGNLPFRLEFLKKNGLEIRFVKDIKSYKKLIYALSEFNDEVIITVDDDLAYSSTLVERLMNMHYKYPKSVCSTRCKEPQWDELYKSFLPYRNWKESRSVDNVPHMAVGYGGVLYPPHCFDDEVFNSEVYTKYCPFADDVWFWAMEIKNGTTVKVLEPILGVYSIDIFYQHFHKNTALSQVNVDKDENDVQIKAVMDLYGLWDILRCRYSKAEL